MPFGLGLPDAPSTGSAPNIVTVTGLGTVGGATQLGGTGFLPNGDVFAYISGTYVQLSASWVNSTKVVATLVSSSWATGSWNVTMVNPDGQGNTDFDALKVTAIDDPQTIFGAGLSFQYVGDDAQTDAFGVNKVPDRTGNGNDLLQSAGSTTFEPSLVANDARFNGHKGVLHSGSQFMSCSALSIGAGHTLFVYGVCKFISNNNFNDAMVAYANSALVFGMATNANNNAPYVLDGSGVVTVDSAFGSINGGPGINFLVGNVGNGASNITASLYTDNDPGVTHSAATTWLNGGSVLEVGRRNGAQYANVAWAEIGGVNVVPTADQRLRLFKYLSQTYQADDPLTVFGTTPVKAVTPNAPMRIRGSGFVNGISGSLKIGTTSYALTLNFVSSQLVECTAGIPSAAAGNTGNLTLTNPDGQVIDYNGVTFTSEANPMVMSGLNCKAWYEADAQWITLGTGNNVAGWTDRSLRLNDQVQATTLDQPTWNATDADFLNRPSVQSTGSPINMACAAFQFDGVPSSLWVIAVVKQTSTTGDQMVWNASMSTLLAVDINSGTPRVWSNGTTKAWTGTISGAHALMGRHDGTTMGITVDSGTEQTVANAATLSDSKPFNLFDRSNNSTYMVGKIAHLSVYNSMPDFATIYSSYLKPKYGLP